MPSPQYNDASVLAGTRGAGNVLPFHPYAKHSTRKSGHKPIAPRRRVRLFLGNNAEIKAIEWASTHGEGSAIALPDGRDPVDVEWPVGALIKVVEDRPEPVARLSALAVAMRQGGVFYAAIPHQPEWPNLWPWPLASEAAP
jgi:hypothetical protein